MALKAKDLTIKFNMDEFTWDDWSKARSYFGLLEVCGRICEVSVDGKLQEDARKVLGQLGFQEIKYIDQMLTEAIREMTNPVDESGKN